jgi:transaldolase
MNHSPFKTPLHQMAATTPTDYWNDSCSIEELAYAIENGAVGATSNPSIVLDVLKKEMPLWRERIHQIIDTHPTWNEVEIAWQIIEELAVKGAELLLPVFEREGGRKGRLSIQTNPTFYRDSQSILAQALHFDRLAPNMQIKIPVTFAGIRAIEEATYHGININATVCFCVPQSLAVAEAVERGLARRKVEGKPIDNLHPVCTIMIGRLDDWIHILEKRDEVLVPPGTADWAGIACFKKAYGLYQERSYHTRLLAAAYRHSLHWSELIGGDVILTIPSAWQRLFNASHIPVVERFSSEVPVEVLNNLLAEFPDFRRAYAADGLQTAEFDHFGPTARTLRTFISSYHDLLALVRDFMLPNPDIK